MANEPAARRRCVRAKKGPHRPMGAFYFTSRFFASATSWRAIRMIALDHMFGC